MIKMSYNETLGFMEYLINREMDEIFLGIGKWSRECADHNEEYQKQIQKFKVRYAELYAHLKNIESMKTSAFGR